MNVAFTRAKHKLIMIGALNDLKETENIGRFMELAVNNNQVRISVYSNLNLPNHR